MATWTPAASVTGPKTRTVPLARPPRTRPRRSTASCAVPCSVLWRPSGPFSENVPDVAMRLRSTRMSSLTAQPFGFTRISMRLTWPPRRSVVRLTGSFWELAPA